MELIKTKTKYKQDHNECTHFKLRRLSSGLLACKICKLSTTCLSVYLLAYHLEYMRGLTIQQRMQSSNRKIRYMLSTILITLLPALLMSSIYPTT